MIEMQKEHKSSKLIPIKAKWNNALSTKTRLKNKYMYFLNKIKLKIQVSSHEINLMDGKFIYQ